VEPFGNNKGVHPTEKTPKDDVSGDDFGNKSGIVTVVNSIGTFDEDSHAHVDNTENDGHLHLNIVDQGKFVAGKSPNWILTHQISAIEACSGVYVVTGDLHSFRMSVIHRWVPDLSFSHVVAGAKDVSLDSEELVIDQSTVGSKETHEKHEISKLLSILESWNLFQGVVEKGQNKTEEHEEGTVTHITEHHSEEEWESNDGDERWVSFQIRRDTIGIDDALEHKSEIVDFEVSWSWDGMIVIGADLTSCVVLKSLLDLVFLLDWSPVVTDVLLVLGFHRVESLVKRLLFCEEHLVDINSRRSLVNTIGIDFVEFQKDFSERLFGLDVDRSGSSDSFFDFLNLSWNLPNFRKFDSLTLWLESVANSLDSISDVISVPEHDDEDRSLWLLNFFILSVVGVLLNVHVGFTLGGSENQFSQSENFLLLDDASDVLDVD